MFCPIGYTTLNRVMRDNFDSFSWEGAGLEGTISRLFDIQNGLLSAWMAKHLTKNELIERVVFEGAYSMGLFMCAPDGRLLKLEVPIFQGTDYWTEIDRYKSVFLEDDYDYSSNTFIARAELDKIDELLSEGKDPWFTTKDNAGFTTLNYHFSRVDYSISAEVFKDILRLSQYTWPFGGRLSVRSEKIQPFEGWSLCVSDETASSLTTDLLRKKFVVKVLAMIFDEEESSLEEKEDTTSVSVGRPRVRDEAAQAFLKYFSLTDKPTWKEAARILKDRDGINISPRSLQRGVSELD